MFENLTFIGLLQKGGITVVVLALLSIISIAIMLERAWAFRKFGRELSEFSGTLASTINGGRFDEAARLCNISKSPLAPVFLSGYAKRALSKPDILRAMEIAGRLELQRLERFLGILGTIGSTAPFIGLFGTVLGIIRAFSDLSISHGASPAAVADGIAEALVATAAGLFVAVPAVMAYNYFVRSANRQALNLEAAATGFVDDIAVNSGAGK